MFILTTDSFMISVVYASELNSLVKSLFCYRNSTFHSVLGLVKYGSRFHRLLRVLPLYRVGP